MGELYCTVGFTTSDLDGVTLHLGKVRGDVKFRERIGIHSGMLVAYDGKILRGVGYGRTAKQSRDAYCESVRVTTETGELLIAA
jgi:hypothetical protein